MTVSELVSSLKFHNISDSASLEPMHACDMLYVYFINDDEKKI